MSEPVCNAVIVNFTGGRANWGSQATSVELFEFLKKTIGDNGHQHLSTIPYPPSFIGDDILRLRNGSAIRSVFDGSATPKDLETFKAATKARFAPLLSRLADADVVFFQAEGAMGSSKRLFDTRLFGLPVYAKLCLQKPVYFINSSIVHGGGSETDTVNRILSLFDGIFVREASSLKVAQKMGLQNLHLCPDMAFLSTQRKVASILTDDGEELAPESYFCVTGSANLKNYSAGLLGEIIRELAQRYSAIPLLLYSRPTDKEFFKSLSKYLDGDLFKTVSSYATPSYDEMLTVLRGAKFCIGGRYHTMISALTQGTPVIATASNSHKSEGVGPMLGLEIPVFKPNKVKEILIQAEKIGIGKPKTEAQILKAVRRLRSEFEATEKILKIAVRTHLSQSNHQLANTSDRLSPYAAANSSLAKRIESYLSVSENLAVYDRSSVQT